MFHEDFKFLNDKEVLYVSKGEDFNVNTYYSEYKILKILGQGGFGKVYAAIHKKTKEKVAIKMTNAGGLDNAEDIESIFSEAETLKSLVHPNIVKIINFFVIKKTLQTYFIMEHLEGGELLKFVEEKKALSEEDALVIFKQIISAIDYCHRQKIIHRDLKLENIMKVDNESLTIKIVDFGIAGLFAGRKSEVTRAGSLYYMAPEVLSRRNLVAAPSMDIWAVGCILYALVIGNLPFNDKSEAGLVKKIVESELEFPKNAKLSPEVFDLLEQMLNKNHEKRIKMSEIQQHPWFMKQKLWVKKEKQAGR
jgi:MAP/microtubule affinity-regulating kinase